MMADMKQIFGRYKILLVEDETLLRQSMQKFLERQGFQVLTSGNGEEALLFIDEANLILTDMKMPRGNGLTVIDANRKSKNKPIIVMTGFTDSTTEELLAMGVYDILHKPVDREELLTKIQEVLNIDLLTNT